MNKPNYWINLENGIFCLYHGQILIFQFTTREAALNAVITLREIDLKYAEREAETI